jgi:hypothetical protein
MCEWILIDHNTIWIIYFTQNINKMIIVMHKTELQIIRKF